jgi:hypothetical protein
VETGARVVILNVSDRTSTKYVYAQFQAQHGPPVWDPITEDYPKMQVSAVVRGGFDPRRSHTVNPTGFAGSLPGARCCDCAFPDTGGMLAPTN